MSEPDYSFQQEVGRLIEAGQLEDALRFVEQQEPNRPDDYLVFAAKNIILGRLGRFEAAIDAADRALEIKPESHETHSNKGVSLYRLGRYDEAIASFDKCLSLRPHYPIAAHQKIFALAQLGRYADAIQVYETSDLPDHDEAVWLNILGYVYLNSGDDTRAEPFLRRALKIDPLLSHLHFNLTEMYRRTARKYRALLHHALYKTLLLLERSSIWRALRDRRSAPHIAESKRFSGPGTVFQSPSQQRETRSILKLLRDMNATALCNDTWLWFAVNIPYGAIEQNGVHGDVDIILKRPRHFMEHDAGFTYRGFQVKTIAVSKDGHIRSAKRGPKKHREIKKQLDVLRNFGCEQIFLLELYVLERGYSRRNNYPSPEVIAEIREKAIFLEKLGYGYVVMAEEPSWEADEESGGIYHHPINVLPAQSNPIGDSFQRLVDGIDAFLASPECKNIYDSVSRHEGFGLKVGYCGQCKRLTMLVPVGHTMHVCGLCKASAY